jgi:RNA polymerase sigma-70 factor, ECF subfamily
VEHAAGLTQVRAASDEPPGAADPDQSLVERARTGDTAAFGALVRRHERWVFTLVVRMVGSRQEAEDVAQEVFLKAFRGMRHFRGAARFSTWLHTIATNHTLTYLAARASSRRREVEPSDRDQPPILERLPHVAPGPDAVLEGRDLRDLLERGLAQVSAEHRIVLVLRDVQGLSYEAIAEVLDVELGTVRSRLHRARSAMKTWLAPHLGRDGA